MQFDSYRLTGSYILAVTGYGKPASFTALAGVSNSTIQQYHKWKAPNYIYIILRLPSVCSRLFL